MSEFRGKFEVLLDLFEALSRLDHLGHLIPRHNKVALLLLQVAHSPADVRRTVAGHVRTSSKKYEASPEVGKLYRIPLSGYSNAFYFMPARETSMNG
jgi:hypothetical protein